MSLGRELAARHLRELLNDEIQLKLEQGFSVPMHLRDEVKMADYLALHEIETQLESLPEPPELNINEPLEWQVPSLDLPAWEPTEDQLQDKMLGAWYGRIAGCILGKPLEIHPFFESPKKLRQYLEATNQWPLQDFVVHDEAVAVAIAGQKLGCTPSQKGKISYAQSDDDLRYTLCGLRILDKHPRPETKHIAEYWASHWTPELTFTAEQAVIANTYAFGGPHPWAFPKKSLADYVALRQYRNPYREWIGAAIRADGWAFGFAGNPEHAARAAQQDARYTHERNGEYSEIFFSAWIAASFRMSSAEAFDVALSTIPAGSRLAKTLVATRAKCEDGASLDEMLDYVAETTGHYHAVHAINNAAVCVAGVFLCGGDFEKAITTAVMFGLDTDCNGATVGSLMGSQMGASALPVEKWISPFNDTIDFEYLGEERQSITALAGWTADLWRRLR
ncbi:MAG TPA: ADP-ribosylglycohydrolase family protein [Fimbriimonas sp.]|nr:ADP-ribosylglycohydrolase family protein [Fimbriimonas sp.]